MNRFTCVFTTCVLGAASLAAVSKSAPRLTVQRVWELTAPSNVPAPKSCRVQVSKIGQTVLTADKPEGQLTSSREAIFPTDFTTTQAPGSGGMFLAEPPVPTNFEKVNTGWTVHLSAKSLGKLVIITGSAEYVEAGLVPAGYGAVAGPVYADDTMIHPNVVNLPRVQSTTTHFKISALPGESYDVNFYRGDKVETHRVSVSIK